MLKQNKIKSAKLQEEDKKAYLMLDEIYKTGGYKEENYDDSKIKSATKRDTTAFIITSNYKRNKNQYHLRAEAEQEEKQKQQVKSAATSKKPAYLRIKEFKETGAIE
jgi:hypothetical protein